MADSSVAQDRATAITRGPRTPPRRRAHQAGPARRALTEFAAKGRTGARVSEIAGRAGVNKQLISYYFGGKDGLYRALVEGWQRHEEEFAAGTFLRDRRRIRP